jgi:hypothetical protein
LKEFAMPKLPTDSSQLRKLSSAYGATRTRLLRSVDDGLSESERVELLTATFDLAEVRVAQGDEQQAEQLYESGIKLGLIFVSPRYPLIEQQLVRIPAKFNNENPLASLLHRLSPEDKIRIFDRLSGKQKSGVAKSLTPKDRRLLKLEAEPEPEEV